MTERDVRLPDPGKLVVSSSPHIHDGDSVRRIMLLVIAALTPACITGLIFFGIRALWVLLVCAGGCVGFEWLFARLMKRPVRISDGSALLTGILLGMNVSAATPAWICLVGCFLAIYLGKMLYGGLGYNPFNPALVGRVGLLIAFPGALTTWVRPVDGLFTWVKPVDAMTTATPLGTLGVLKSWAPAQVMRMGEGTLSYWDCAIGHMGGCIGETSALALLAGGLFLIAVRVIRWQIPVAFIGSVFVFTGIAHAVSPDVYAPPVFHLLVGGLFLGAFFMATDMVTSPMTGVGALLFGAGCGIITCVIRLWGSYPEGVSFSILIMNAMAPLIDRYTGLQPFGAVRSKEATA